MIKRFKKIAVGATLVGVGALVLSVAGGCTIALKDDTCAVQSAAAGGCAAGESSYQCQGTDTPITFDDCSPAGAAGGYCCTPHVVPDAGSPDTSAPDSGAQGACNSCLVGQCGAQWSVCAQSADCTAIYTCATACAAGDQTCVNNCYKAKPAGQPSYLALATCDIGASCGSCKATCSTPASACTTPPDAGALDCGGCSSTKCAAEKQACASGSDCDDYTQCIAVCKDAPCVDACGLAHEVGKAASEAFGTCVSSKCKVDCGL